jgi:osmotically-inducible protein OsmY
MAARLLCVTQAIVLAAATTIVAEAAQQHVSLPDQQIKAQVEHRLLDHHICGVVVAVRDGTVTLTGTAVGEAVAAKLRRYVFFTIFDDVDVEVNDGVATLTGYVTMPYKSRAMVELASRVDRVQQVVDKLEVLPVSGFDDHIRYAAAVRIYNDPLFWNYAIQVNPPIHIVVKHGRVTLSGVVMSEVERRKAELIALEIFGVLSVENKLRLERGP